jgi:hypothetical protein
LCELVRHRDRLKQDFEDRVRQSHRLVDLGFPEFTRYVKGMEGTSKKCPNLDAAVYSGGELAPGMDLWRRWASLTFQTVTRA